MDISLNEIDYRWVESTSDIKILKKALKILKDDGGYFPDLEKKIEEKIFGKKESADVERDEKIRLGDELKNWEKDMEGMDSKLRKAKQNESSQAGISSEILEIERTKKAEKLKIDGNDAMKMKAYNDAIKLYSESISLNSRESSTYCNRALTYFKIGNFEKSVEDCNKAIELSKTYSKAYYRRGCSYSALKQFENAWDDFNFLLKEMPSNTEIMNEMEDVKRKWRIHVGEDEWKIIAKTFDPIKPVQVNKIEPAQAAAEPNSTKPEVSKFKKIKIVEDDSENMSQATTEIPISTNSATTNTKTAVMQEVITKKPDAVQINEKKQVQPITQPNAAVKKRPKIEADSEVVLKATKIINDELNFDIYSRNSEGFANATMFYSNTPEVFFRFLKHFTASCFLSSYEKIQLSVNTVAIIHKNIKAVSGDWPEGKSEDYNIAHDYVVNIPKTKNFLIIKLMLKNHRQAIENSLNLFDDKSILLKLYF